MVGRRLVLLMLLLPVSAVAQEVLLPLQHAVVPPRREVKLQPIALTLPFFDDFSAGNLVVNRWQQQGGATVSMDVSPLAPTVGILTLDALDGSGCLYSQATTSVFPADTATSLPVSLNGLLAADSVVFSFYYLPGGGYGNLWERVGFAPDSQDSLFLDFYRAADSSWHNVWSVGGISVDSLRAHTGRDWQYVAVAVTDNGYFDSTFCFRFRNYASLEVSPKAGKAGNCDFWHIDYIVLDSGRTVTAEPEVRDIAFAAPAGSFLSSYRAMPFGQYVVSDMASNADVTITNRFSSTLASHYGYSIFDSIGNEVYSYDGGYENAPPFMPNGTYQTASAHAHPAIDYAFPPMTSATDYTIVHTVREGAGGDLHQDNDTIRFVQRFGDYYAYDDGSAENGYSLTSTSSTLYLAYRFDLNRPDTLTAVDLFFNATLHEENESIPFYLTLWEVGANGKPSELIYRDPTRRYPHTGAYHRYILEEPVIVEGNIFVGFEQRGNDFINLGFDRSLNTSDRIYYLTDTAWRQSFLSGSLLMRPCFGVAATVGIAERSVDEVEYRVYPNPSSDRVYAMGELNGMELYDMQGRRLKTTRGNQMIVSDIPNGIYLLRIISSTRSHCHPVTLIVNH